MRGNGFYQCHWHESLLINEWMATARMLPSLPLALRSCVTSRPPKKRHLFQDSTLTAAHILFPLLIRWVLRKSVLRTSFMLDENIPAAYMDEASGQLDRCIIPLLFKQTV